MSSIQIGIIPRAIDWAVDYSLPYTSIAEDYAIVSRAVDPAPTGQWSR